MNERLTDEQLAAIRERADAATPGPWKVAWDGDADPDGAWSAEWPWLIRQDIYPGKSVANLAEVEASTEDAEFIAYARTDIPALLAEIDRFKRAIRELDVLLRDFQTAYVPSDEIPQLLECGERAALVVESVLA